MVKRKDLVDISDKDYKQRQGEFIQCQECGDFFGGIQGDYFAMEPNDIFTCPGCKSENLALVKEVRTIEIVKQ